jgi:transposase-like protein
MEVAGLVVGIVGLYSACQSCYNLFSETKNSVSNATLAARELEIHGSILKAWVRRVKSQSLPKPKSTHKSSLDLPQWKEEHPPTLAFNDILPHIY